MTQFIKLLNCANLLSDKHSDKLSFNWNWYNHYTGYISEDVWLFQYSIQRIICSARIILCYKTDNNSTCLSLSICATSRSRSILVKSLSESTLRPFSLDADRPLQPPAELLLVLLARPSNSWTRLYSASFSSKPQVNCSQREAVSAASWVSASYRQHAAAKADSASANFCCHSSLSSWYLQKNRWLSIISLPSSENI